MVLEKKTSRHYYTEDELIQLLSLPQDTEIELIKMITDQDIEDAPALKLYKCEITTIETIDYDEKAK